MTKLTQMNISQLRKACRTKGIYGVSRMNKKNLRKTLITSMGDLYEFKENNDILYIILSEYISEVYWCQVSQVSKTYNKVMREVGFSPWYCMCPRCEALVLKGEYDIKRDISWQPLYNNTKDYIHVINNSLNMIKNTIEYNNKAIEFYDMFCSIAMNMWIFEFYPKLKISIFITLINMKNDKNVDLNIRKLSILISKLFFPIIFPDLHD